MLPKIWAKRLQKIQKGDLEKALKEKGKQKKAK